MNKMRQTVTISLLEFPAGAQLTVQREYPKLYIPNLGDELPNSQMPIGFLQMPSHFLPSNHTVKEHRLPLTVPLAELPAEKAAKPPCF